MVYTFVYTISKMFFSKNLPRGLLSRKTAVSRGFSAYVLDRLVSNLFLIASVSVCTRFRVYRFQFGLIVGMKQIPAMNIGYQGGKRSR